MLNNYLNRPRRKAWIGAAIGAAVGLGSTLFGAAQSRKAQKEQYRIQKAVELRNIGLTSAANATQAYFNIDDLDREFRQRFMKYGGLKKFSFGGWSDVDTSNLINSLGAAGQNIISNISNKAHQQGIYPTAIKINSKELEDNKAVYDSAARSELLNNYYRTSSLRCGGKCMRR